MQPHDGPRDNYTKYRKIQIPYIIDMCIQNMTQINISMKQNQTHRRREQTHCQGRGGSGGREGNNWEVGVSR